MIVDKWNVRGGDNSARKPSTVKGIYGRYCRRYRRTLNVYVSLRGSFIDVDVQYTAVLVAFFYHIISNFNIPVGITFPGTKKYLKEKQQINQQT